MLSVTQYFFMFFFLTVVPTAIVLIYYRELIFGGPTQGGKTKITASESRLDDFLAIAHTGKIRILTGEASPRVFNEKIVDSFKQAKKRGCQIIVMSGPFLILDSQSKKSILAELATDGIVDYYFLEKRYKDHFTVDSKGLLYYELEHPPNADKRTGVYFKNNKFEAKHYVNRFDDVIQSFGATKFEKGKNEPLYLTEAQVDEILSILGGNQKINNLNRDGILELLQNNETGKSEMAQIGGE